MDKVKTSIKYLISSYAVGPDSSGKTVVESGTLQTRRATLQAARDYVAGKLKTYPGHKYMIYEAIEVLETAIPVVDTKLVE